MSTAVTAQQGESAETGVESGNVLGRPGTAAGQEPTFMDLLEFLGEFETEDGSWIDPGELLDEFEADIATDSNVAGTGDDNDE